MFGTLRGLWHRAVPGRIMRWTAVCEWQEGIPFFDKARPALVVPQEATWEEYQFADLESVLIANFTGGMYAFTGDLASLSPDNRKLVARYIALFQAQTRMDGASSRTLA